MEKKTKIIFDEEGIPFILEALGCTIDKNGYVINDATKNFVLDVWGNTFLAKNFKGAVKNKGFFFDDLQLIIDPGEI